MRVGRLPRQAYTRREVFIGAFAGKCRYEPRHRNRQRKCAGVTEVGRTQTEKQLARDGRGTFITGEAAADAEAHGVREIPDKVAEYCPRLGIEIAQSE